MRRIPCTLLPTTSSRAPRVAVGFALDMAYQSAEWETCAALVTQGMG